jgi:hypothetical protein
MAMGVGWVSRFDDLRMDEMLPESELRIVTRLVTKSARIVMLDLASARLWMSRFFILFALHMMQLTALGGKAFHRSNIASYLASTRLGTKFAHMQHE